MDLRYNETHVKAYSSILPQLDSDIYPAFEPDQRPSTRPKDLNSIKALTLLKVSELDPKLLNMT